MAMVVAVHRSITITTATFARSRLTDMARLADGAYVCQRVTGKTLGAIADSVGRGRFGHDALGPLGIYYRPEKKELANPRVRDGAHFAVRPGVARDLHPRPAKPSMDDMFFDTSEETFVAPLMAHVSAADMPKNVVELRDMVKKSSAVCVALEGDINLGATAEEAELLRALLAPMISSVERRVPVVVLCGPALWVERWTSAIPKATWHRIVLAAGAGGAAGVLPSPRWMIGQPGPVVAECVEVWHGGLAGVCKLATDGIDDDDDGDGADDAPVAKVCFQCD